MHPEQRWMIKYLIVSTTLAVVGATVAVTDPPLERLGALAARVASPGWTAVTRLAPTVQTAAAALPQITDEPADEPSDTPITEVPQNSAPALAQAPTPSAPFPPPPAVATPIPALPIFAAPVRAIALPVMARTLGYIEAHPDSGQRCAAVRSIKTGTLRQRTRQGCTPVTVFKIGS